MTGTPRRSVAEVLACFEADFSAFATGFAQGDYMLWLGSGISRDVVPGVPKLLEQMLEFLRTSIDQSNPVCRFRVALEEVLQIAGITGSKWLSIDLSTAVTVWADLEHIVDRLVDKYADVLDVQVQGEAEDFLVWTGLDVPNTYGSPGLKPDVEHLCVAILMLEGVVRSSPTTNWDGLIEAAMSTLVDNAGQVLSVMVTREDFTGPERQAELVKFHGCAVRASEDEFEYRSRLIARKSQISGWTTQPENQVMKNHLEHLFATRPALIVGLSAQDANIHTVWQQAIQNIGKTWPASPPAVVFAEEQLSHHHKHVMRVEYGSDYSPNAATIQESALLRAFAKPTLVALALFTLADKLCALVDRVSELQLPAVERDHLRTHIRDLRDLVGRAADADPRALLDTLVAGSAMLMSVFRKGVMPTPGDERYQPLSTAPVTRAIQDPNFPDAALGRFGIAVALLSRGHIQGAWDLSMGNPSNPTKGVLQMSSGPRRRHVFLVSDARALAELEGRGLVDLDDPEVLVLHAVARQRPATRSPRARLGRVGKPVGTTIDLEGLCGSATTADVLFEAFRLEAAV